MKPDLAELRARIERDRGPGWNYVTIGADEMTALLDEIERLHREVDHAQSEETVCRDVLRAEHQACKELRELVHAARKERDEARLRIDLLQNVVEARNSAIDTYEQQLATSRESGIREGFELAVDCAVMCHEAECMHDNVESHINWTEARAELEACISQLQKVGHD